MNTKVSEVVRRVKPSPTTQAADKARDLRRSGVKIYDLSAGEPNFKTPQVIVDAAMAAIQRGETHYTASKGIPELAVAVAEKLAIDNNIQVSPDHVIATPSAKFALFLAFKTLVSPGDEVIIPTPAWVSFAPMIQLCGGIPVYWELDPETYFSYTVENLIPLLTPRTKAIVVNSPSNPSGAIIDPHEVEALVALADKHDFYIVSDEIYEKLVYDEDVQLVSPASLDLGAERTFTVNGFSKSYAMTGWRLGYLVPPTDFVEAAATVQDHALACAGSFIQHAGVAALRETSDSITQMVQELGKRRDYLHAALSSIPGVKATRPAAGMFLFPSFAAELTDGLEPAEYLMDNLGVVGTQGAVFGAGLERYIRLSFGGATEEIIRAADVMVEHFLNK